MERRQSSEIIIDPVVELEAGDNSSHMEMVKGTETTTTSLEKVNDHTATNHERNVSNTSTLSSIICVVAGSGILAIAHALSQSGWIGLLFLFLSACMSQFTGIILIKCLYTEKHGRLRDYADIGYIAFGRPGQWIGFLFSQLMLFLTPTIYIILASENISDILYQSGFIWLDRRSCIWIVAVVIGVPFVLVRNMRDVSFLSTFASMATVCLILVVCVVSMTDFNAKAHMMHHDFAIPRNIPIAFSTFSFSFCGHVIYPQLEASMITPKRWSKVLLVATCVISLMYFTIGLLCYLVFGNTVQSPIYKSLPAGSSQHVAMFVITVHVLLAIPIYLYVFTLRIESWLHINTLKEQQQELQEEEREIIARKSKLMQIILRIGEVILCGVIAMFIPYFSDFMALVGTILSDTLTFILPCLFWMKLNWNTTTSSNNSKNYYFIEFIICLVVATIGICCATFGTIDAVKQLIRDYTT